MLRLLTEAEDAHELMIMPGQKTNNNFKEKTNNSMQNTLYKTKTWPTPTLTKQTGIISGVPEE